MISLLGNTIFALLFAGAVSLPGVPTDPDHPGSKVYDFTFKEVKMQCVGRELNVFLPQGPKVTGPLPVVVFGHGQALGLDNYRATLEHLAKKGVAVIYSTFDNGFFDQDWQRMAQDFVAQTSCVLSKYSAEIHPEQVIFTGHSKGAYVASIAAGVAGDKKTPFQLKATLLFAPAGWDQKTLAQMNSGSALTVVFSDSDTVVEKNISEQIYLQAPAKVKQFILVKSYAQTSPQVKADHFWPVTKGSFFGGGGEGPLHYYGSWKWLVAAAQDVVSGAKSTNEYLYGDKANDKGLPDLEDDIQR